MSIIDDFIKFQESKMNWGDREYLRYLKVEKTSVLGLGPDSFKFEDEKKFRPSGTHKLFGFLGIIAAVCFLIYSIHAAQYQLWPLAISAVAIFVCALAIVYCVWFSFLNPRYFYSILLNSSGIQCGPKQFDWKELQETCIMKYEEATTNHHYLVLFKKDGSHYQFDLKKFRWNEGELATFIEYYKHLAVS